MTPKFRLATLLKLRLDERDRRRNDLAQAMEAERVLQTRLADLDHEIAAVRENSAATKLGPINVDDLLQSNRYELMLRAQRKGVEGQIAQVRAEIERRRQALVEADRNVRVLEKLRERQLEAAAAEESRLEAKEFDEIALIGYRRSGGDA